MLFTFNVKLVLIKIMDGFFLKVKIYICFRSFDLFGLKEIYRLGYLKFFGLFRVFKVRWYSWINYKF